MSGRAERADWLDHLLWRGFAGEALPELRLMLRCETRAARAQAAWVLARHAAARQDWRAARRALDRFHATPEGPERVNHPGPYLLTVQARARDGDAAGAEAIRAEAEARFGAGPDLALAALEIARAAADEAGITRALGQVHAGSDQAGLTLAPGQGARFDRIAPATQVPGQRQGDGPKVSVILPVFNGRAVLGRALDGLAAQSWQNLEILVVDDASTDGSRALAEARAAADPRIRVLAQVRNAGAYAARNAGLAAATGAFFTVHDADDWSHPQKIETQVRALLAAPAAAASVSHWVRMAPDLGMSLWRMETSWVYRNVSSLMLRREMRETLGYWDRVRVNADTEYWHRLIAAHGAAAVIEVAPGVPLAFGRSLPDSLTLRRETHLSSQFRGVRRDYLEAARYWQDSRLAALPEGAAPEVRAAALHLKACPGTRPFRVPAGIGPADPPGPATEYDRIAEDPLFDRLWYLARNRDVLAADADPVRHHLDYGGAEDRDPGPGLAAAAWRRHRDLPPGALPLLDYAATGRAEGADPRPGLTGGLDPDGRPPVLIFGHSADRAVFGAERSFLDMLEALATGFGPFAASAPVAVLPLAVNAEYLAEVRARAAAVEILPQIWRHKGRSPHPVTLEAARALIRRHAPREVHVNTLVLDAPLAAARAEGCPAVVHVRELPAEDEALCRVLGEGPAALRRGLLAEADRFVANSPAVADWLGVPERVILRPNRIDPALYALPFLPHPGLRVALVSSNIAKKGIADFLAVARLVDAAETAAGICPGARCRFRLIGPATADLAALHPLPANVEQRGYAPDARAAMAQADVVLSLSKFAESFGRTVLEAMAAGRPVVCYDRGMPPRLIAHGRTGFAVPADSPEAVALAVLGLSAGRRSLARISAAARQHARNLATA